MNIYWDLWRWRGRCSHGQAGDGPTKTQCSRCLPSHRPPLLSLPSSNNNLLRKLWLLNSQHILASDRLPCLISYEKEEIVNSVRFPRLAFEKTFYCTIQKFFFWGNKTIQLNSQTAIRSARMICFKSVCLKFFTVNYYKLFVRKNV